MKIRLLTSRVCGNGKLQEAGEVIDLPRPEALRMLETGQAEPVVVAGVVEAETAMEEPTKPPKRKPKRRGKKAEQRNA